MTTRLGRSFGPEATGKDGPFRARSCACRQQNPASICPATLRLDMVAKTLITSTVTVRKATSVSRGFVELHSDLEACN